MENVIFHNFGGARKSEEESIGLEKENQTVTPVEIKHRERTEYVILARQLELSQFLRGIIGWGKSSDTMSIRQKVVESMSDEEVMDVLFDSNETLWKSSPAYYYAVLERVDSIMMKTSSVYKEIYGKDGVLKDLDEEKVEEEENLTIMQIYEDFTEDFNAPPMDSYISYFDTSTVGEMDKTSTEGDKNKPCLVVKLRDKLPEGMSIPNVYKGVRVFVS